MLTESNGETHETSEPVVNAPVAAHTTNVVVWDIPSAVVAGERFTMKVGIKCSDECDLTTTAFDIYDEQGTHVATGTMPGDLWPGTAGLYVADIELEAPAAEELYTWSVKACPIVGEIPHAEGVATFGLRVVSHPECLVKVEAVDRESQAPLEAARVMMHPYTALTDDHGVAEVRVPKGNYRLFVSQPRYLTFGVALDVAADITTRAELDIEPVTERN
jgi:hypothetical protein